MKGNINSRVAWVQGAVNAMFCVTISFFVQIFQRFGYDKALIGFIMMGTSIVALVAQPVWGMLIDRTGSPRRLTLLCAAGSAVCYFVLVFSGGVKPLAIGATAVIYALFYPMNGMVDSWVSKLINEGYRINYGQTRSAGSLCYALAAVVLGFAVARLGLWVAAAIMAAVAVWTCATLMRLPDPVRQTEGPTQRPGVRQAAVHLMRNRPYMLFVLAYFLMSMTMTPENTYYPVVIAEMGGDEAWVGVGLFLMAMCEMPSMIFFDRVRMRLKLHSGHLLAVSMFMFFLKGMLMGLAPTGQLVIVASMLHGLSYAIFVPASVLFIRETVRDEYLSTAQLLANSVGASLAAILANPISGLYAEAQGTQAMLRGMSLITLAGAGIMLLVTRAHKRASDNKASTTEGRI